jgi:cellobiose PTS system EIIB component
MKGEIMRTITLICAGGFSSSILLKEMEKSSDKKGLDIKFNAISESKFDQYKDETDILLLAPQVRYLEKQILSKYNMDNIKIMIIDSIDYGLMNGEKVLTDALNL